MADRLLYGRQAPRECFRSEAEAEEAEAALIGLVSILFFVNGN